MAEILYAGHVIPLPETVDVEELSEFLQDAYAKGAHSWATFDVLGDHPKQVRLLLGPGIPVGLYTDGGSQGSEVRGD